MRRRRTALVAAVALAGGLQVLPVGQPRTNPPIETEIAWSSAETRALFFRACGDCHSNETRWPWYSRVAPVSWLIVEHVQHGRGTINVSAWSAERFGEDARKSAATIRDASMPPGNYLRLHRDAALTENERAVLIAGLEATMGTVEQREAE